jgi:hypothetical protein
MSEETKEKLRLRYKERTASKKLEAAYPPAVLEDTDVKLTGLSADTSIENAKKSSKAIKTSSGIKWFTEVDYNPKGKVSGDYPAYYFEAQMYELEENIRDLGQAIEDGVFQGTRKRDEMKRLKTMTDRLEKIKEGKPKLSPVDKDRMSRSLRELCDDIKKSQYSYDECWKQTADPHELAKRMEQPCIEIKNELVGSYAKQRGMRIKDGKISQNHATMIASVMAKLIGEHIDVSYRK